jgi:hypothetical protein
MLGYIEATCWGGPEDGAVVIMDSGPYRVFRRFIGGLWENSTYVLEVTESGSFRLLHLYTGPAEAKT